MILGVRTTQTVGGGLAHYSYLRMAGKEVSHGKGTQFYPNGTRKTEVHFRYGVRHGRDRAWFPTGRPAITGAYRMGKKHGKWNSWYSNGKRRESLNYRAGKLHGRCVYWWSPGSEADRRMYCNGVETTGGVERRLKISVSRFANGALRIQEEYYWSRGRKTLHGTVFKGNRNGAYVELPFRDGVQFGRGAEFNSRGQLVSEFVVAGGRRKYLNYAKVEF